MKRFLFVFIAVCLLISCTAVGEEMEITWHEVFGLKKGASPEEISTTIQEIFSVSADEPDDIFFSPKETEFLGLPIRWITLHISDKIWVFRGFDISFEKKYITANNIQSICQQLSEVYGDPCVCNITTEVITLNGKELKPLSLDDSEGIQKGIDKCTIRGKICWDNISISFFSTMTEDANSSLVEVKSLDFLAAFSDASLEKEIQDLYGIRGR